MAKLRHASRKPFYFILAFSLIVSIAYITLRSFYSPASPQIMEVSNTSSFIYGKTTMTGILQKDTPIGKPGKYFLTLPDMRLVMLDISNVDSIVGKIVTIEGELVPSVPVTNPPKLIVSKISTIE